MNAEFLRKAMERANKTVTNVASDTDLGTTTIIRYLNGESVNRSTERLLEMWIQRHSKDSGDPEAA